MSSSALNTTFGALLIGTVVSAVLYGFTCIQTWHYFQNYSDNLIVKSSIAALLLLETLHSAFSVHAIYYYVILNYSDPVALLDAVWSATAVLFVTCLITAVVHSFYIWRVYQVSRKNKILAFFLVFLEIVRFGAGFSVPIMALQLKLFADFKTLAKIIAPQDIALSLSMAIDIIIAGSLSFYLHRSRSGMANTDKLIDQLVVHAINNGILTSIADVLCLIMGTTQRSNLIYLSIYQCIGNLYTNSMLATLNARRSTAAKGTSVELSGMGSSFRIASSAPGGRSNTFVGNRPRDSEFDLDKEIEISVHKASVTDVA